MEPFTTLSAIAAPLDMINVDTDAIIPKLFLRTIKRTGLGIHLFNDIRYNEDGTEKPDFVLNQKAYRNAKILIAGENFGCGSSREHAPWALLDFGFRCIIAPSFADIFYNNCFKNGILPVEIKDKDDHASLLNWAIQNKGVTVTIDLEEQTVQWSDHSYKFDIDPFRKRCLMEGLDDIGLTLEKEEHITEFENKDKEKRSWL